MRHIFHVKKLHIFHIVSVLIILGIALASYHYISLLRSKTIVLQSHEATLTDQLAQTKQTLDTASKDLEAMKNRDEFKINKELETEIKNIQKTYNSAVVEYEELIKLRDQK